MVNENLGINASPSAIFELIGNLNNRIKEIYDLNTNLALSLKKLGTTFQDQGYLTLQDHISISQKTVERVMSNMKIVIDRLFEYVDLINESRSIIYNNHQIPPKPHSLKLTYNFSGDLKTTRQTWKPNEDGTITFNSPVETGLMLEATQGKIKDFSGTCGLVSCVNIIRLFSGKAITEEQMVEFAADNNFCHENGATTCKNRRDILSRLGIKNELQVASVDNIAKAVSEGRGVIASVDAGKLWQNPDAGGHAITITSVKKDHSSNVLGFFVCDSGTGGKDSSTFYPTDHIKNALTGRELNVTMIIR